MRSVYAHGGRSERESGERRAMVDGSIVENLERDIDFRLVRTVGGLQSAIESMNPRHSEHSTNGIKSLIALDVFACTINANFGTI